MIISDLNYLEVTSEASNVVGGGKKGRPGHGRPGHGKPGNNKTVTVNIIKQVAKVDAAVITGKGDAKLEIKIDQNAEID